MKNLFTRHQEALTASEKDELWSEMQRELSRDSRGWKARAAATGRTVRSALSGSPSRFLPMPWPAVAAVGLVAVVTIALIVGHPWDRMRPAVPGTDSTKNAVPATVPTQDPEPAAGLTQNRERSTSPARSLVPTADSTQNRARTAGPAQDPAPYVRTGPDILPPSLATLTPPVGIEGGPGRIEPGSAAAGGRSQMAAVTPTEQAPSPTAGQNRTERPRPDSALAPQRSDPLAGATVDGPADAIDAGPTAVRASRRPDNARITVERLPSVGNPPTAVRTGGVAGTIRGRVTDKQDRPLAYVNIVVVETGWGAFSKDDGSYAILNVLPGTYSVLTSRIGYGGQSVDSVVVVAGGVVKVNFALAEKPTTLSEVEIVASRERMSTKSTQATSPAPPENKPWGSIKSMYDVVRLKAGVVADSRNLHVRGGSSGASAPDGTPRVPTTGGTTLPNDEVYDSMFFEHYGVNPFIATDEDPLSTFAVDVDAASYTVMRRYVDGGHLPDKDAVRIEEFVNYFKQDYPQFNDTDFRIMIDGAPSPFGKGYQLLRVGIKARDIAAADRKPANLVFVIDISGSMEREDRLELVKRSLRVLVDRLTPRDRVGIVVYGNVAHTILEPISLGLDSRDNARPDGFAERLTWKAPPREDEAPGAARERILAAIESLHPEGATNAEAGLLLGYEMARGIFRDGFINRIILCSDGVANIGQTGPESILERVRGEASRGIQITTIGFGMGNYNDVLMEQLADRGDGNYYYVDEIGEANRVLAENLTGTLQTVARDAKIQVEFDPCCVQRYRLIGFENRDVADRDFRNDKVDAGEIGAGHEVTALYEVKLVEGKDRGRIVTVRFRYLPPDRKSEFEPKAREMEQTFDSSELQRSFYDAPARFRLDAAVAEFAEVLRHSFWAKESRVADVLPVARSAAQDLPDDGAVREFVRLVESAVGLAETLSPEEQRRIQGR